MQARPSVSQIYQRMNHQGYDYRCHKGWTGPKCDVCLPSPHCGHGYCRKPNDCICHAGYQSHFCQEPTCREGCHPVNGFCKKPGECWCKPGWTGANCDECQTYPGCVNGVCDEPWECRCRPGFSGMLCDWTEVGVTTEVASTRRWIWGKAAVDSDDVEQDDDDYGAK